MSKEIVLGLHLYQPPREAFHPSLSHISTDPENKNWTDIIRKQSYSPIAENGLLNHVSFDIYQTLLIQLEKQDPVISNIYKKAMQENGVGEPFIHPILPDLSDTDKNIIIAAGVSRFKEITGQTPKIFWPPETAIDTPTLECLASNGYQGFICAPEQIIQLDKKHSDNQPTKIDLPSGKSLTALPFDRSISRHLAFDPKNNADEFAWNLIKPSLDKLGESQPSINWTDGETFGHHFIFADKFLKHLIHNSLPELGIKTVSINSVLKYPTKPGQIIERSAWSCPHGNLVRWNGQCGCAEGKETTWKASFVSSLSFLNQEISNILYDQIGKDYASKVSSSFYEYFTNPKTINTPEKCLIAAKISTLVSRTSCATFFASPEVSGKINLLYAFQALVYLTESGLTETATDLSNEFYKQLSLIKYPGGQETALSTLNKMLT